MDKKRKLIIAIVIAVILIIIIALLVWQLIRIKNETTQVANIEKNNIVENQIQNNIIENELENNVEENTIVNTVQEENNQTQNNNQKEETEEISKEELESEETNEEKAINIAKKDWGNDSTVYFRFARKNEDGKYLVEVREEETTYLITTYIIDINTEKFVKE